MKSQIKLSLIVPCYNEENNVKVLYDAVKQAFSIADYRYEVVFINDGSNDATLDQLKDICRLHKNANITVVSFSRNFGKEAAILAGFENANGDLVTIIDADLQQRPELVLDMVDILDKNPEYSCVAAFQKNRKEGKFSTWCKDTFYKAISKVCDINLYSGASDFRTFRRDMVNAILKLQEYFRFSKGIFSWVGFKTYYMPYEAQERHAGETKWSFKSLIKYAIEGFISFTTFPLKIANYLGFIMSSLAIIYMIVVLVQKIFFSINISGYATIVVLILLLGGIQLLILGIIGEYLARIYIQGKNRPVYLVEEKMKSIHDEDSDIDQLQ